MIHSTILRLLLSALVFMTFVSGFVQRTPLSSARTLQQAGYQPSSTQLWDRRDDEDVQVNLIPDVDSVTLTAIGFAAIAFNFFVLANSGDGGIAGVLATIINTIQGNY